MVKRRRRFGNKVFFAAILLAVTASVFYYIADDDFEPDFVRYKEFGIFIPVNYPIHGIDVSRYQKEISWRHVAEMKVENIAVGFAFMKATEGTRLIDVQFNRNMAAAKKAGIKRGAYHYFIGSVSGKEQAAHFMNTVALTTGDLPPVLDAEQIHGASVRDYQQRIADWLTAVEKRYGVRPIIYSNADFYTKFLAGKFDEYPLWVAHYYVRDRPRIERPWAFWQHNEKGTVSGIRAKVDFNVFNGDSAAFQELLIK